MKERCNCINCGAPLVYGHDQYESIAKCNYCNTEYHIDRLGKVEEYKIKLQVMGKVREFYIGDMTINIIDNGAFRNCAGQLIRTPITEKIKIDLIEI